MTNEELNKITDKYFINYELCIQTYRKTTGRINKIFEKRTIDSDVLCLYNKSYLV